ncbi:hypothetical protein IQ279_06915 [Streptomyces verrucosisporus]|uniref:hypothetical protein n=1 Tax=Streptomyces verrucosisporus TaxID=1695161 RepID=UPI0019D27C9C|nr:hypothetical protein [Streptomyces verrucosisporus]MBN3929374.1 hypothetical protein [Streptomyces verrucosisporus]
MYEPRQRASSLRVTALAAGVALAASLPLTAATAGPDERRPGGGRASLANASAEHVGPATAGATGSAPERPPLPLPDGLLSREPSEPSEPFGADLSETSAFCGSWATSPRGLRAQTCVLTRDGTVWGRMYHRNATGEALHGALSLLGPGGQAVAAPCELPAGGREGVCDTPHRPVRGDLPDGGPYTAVAEVAAPGGEGLMLRSGSEAGSETGGAGEAGKSGDGKGGTEDARTTDPSRKSGS